ncbi:hypothetical protein AMTRI_Chr09g37430 [Amborella trichopoda]
MGLCKMASSLMVRELNHFIINPRPSFIITRNGHFSAVFRPSMALGLVKYRSVHGGRVVCYASDSGKGEKVPARLSQMRQLLQEAEERAVTSEEPIPRITLDHVTINFARSGGPGGQNVNKVNTKVDMRFNVKGAYWLSDRVRERILQMEKNRINKDGELVISSTKTRTQK